VHLTGRQGDAEVRIFQGAVTLEDHRGAALVTVERDGTIRATLPEVIPSSPSAFNVFRGSIELWLPSNVHAALDLSSLEGTVESEISTTADPSNAAILATNVKGTVQVRALPADPEE
jgi:hypothetical protein